MAQPGLDINTFLGTDNISDPARVKFGYLREALNIDIDDQNIIHRRDGGDDLKLSASGIHSMWSNDKICLFVQDTVLRKLNTDYTTTALVTNLDPTDRMCYVDINNIIYFSNRSIVGYIQDELPYPFPDPAQTFKVRMVGGQILEFFNNRLYAANDKNLFFSDATILTRMDTRKNAIALPGYITMVRAVVDGLYISANGKTYFFEGLDPHEFKMRPILDLEAIEGTSLSIERDNIGRGMQGKTVYWLTRKGPFKGYPNGVVTHMQNGLFEINNLESGSAIIKDDHGYRQYLAICQLKAGLGNAYGEFKLPKPTFSN